MKKGAFHTYSLLLTKNSNKGYREDSEIRELLNNIFYLFSLYRNKFYKVFLGNVDNKTIDNKTKQKVLVNPTL